MNKSLIVLVCTIFLVACNMEVASEKTHEQSQKFEGQIESVQYDSIATKKLGADKYGMRKYVMAFLKRGPNRDRDSLEAAALQKAHLENIGRMAESGKLALAGPFLDDGEIRGIYIFNVETIEEAEALTATDPAIQAGSLVMELHPWYGSAAVTGINEVHKTLSKQEITEE